MGRWQRRVLAAAAVLADPLYNEDPVAAFEEALTVERARQRALEAEAAAVEAQGAAAVAEECIDLAGGSDLDGAREAPTPEWGGSWGGPLITNPPN